MSSPRIARALEVPIEVSAEVSLDPRPISSTQVQAEAEASYRAGDYEAAAVALDSIVHGGEAVDVPRARFWLGKSLTMLGLPSSALAEFDAVLAGGPSDPFHHRTVAWLVALARELPEGAQVARRIGAHAPVALDDPAFDGVRDELIATVGRFHLRRGDYAQAIAWLRQMPRDSPDYGRARIDLGIAFTLEYRGGSALNAFKDALRHELRESREPVRYAKRRRREDGTPLPTKGEALAHFDDVVSLGMANIFYMVGKFDTAQKYLERVSAGSRHYLDAVLWRAWTEFRMAEVDEEIAARHYARAMGLLHLLNSPFFEERLRPESFVLEAAIYAAACRYDSAWRIADRFDRRYGPRAVELREILDQAPADAALHDLAVQIEDRASPLDPGLEDVVLTLLSETRVRGAFDYVRAVERERSRLGEVLGSVAAGSLRGRLDEQQRVTRHLARARAGARARERIEQGIETIMDAQAQLRRLRATIAPHRRARSEPSPALRRARVQPDDDWEIYRYTGEYWQDELESYRYEGLDVCEASAAP